MKAKMMRIIEFPAMFKYIIKKVREYCQQIFL